MNNDYIITKRENSIDITKFGRIFVKDSCLENIDTIPIDDLKYIISNYHDILNPIATSVYIPSRETMQVLQDYDSNIKVRFKTSRPGTKNMIAISVEEFFAGLKIFDSILSGINPNWSDLDKCKYLYNELGRMLSYDLLVERSSIHEEQARNIFLAISLNRALCSSFAASYDYLCFRAGLESEIIEEEDHSYVVISPDEDYLTDPTFDASYLKFGMHSKNFAISKEQFNHQNHDLSKSTADEGYDFSDLSLSKVLELDFNTGYLTPFNNEYQDEYIGSLASNLEGNNNAVKLECLLERVINLKTVGRPTAIDYYKILNFILDHSSDLDFASSIKINNLYPENDEEPVCLLISLVNRDSNEYETSYLFDPISLTYKINSNLSL